MFTHTGLGALQVMREIAATGGKGRDVPAATVCAPPIDSADRQ
jgi:hypothetical protein